MRFFAHKAGANCALHIGADESAEHLAAKLIIAEAARSTGWNATVEYPSPDRSWIADVLLERDGRCVAVEVQLSSQSTEEFQRRQRRYEAAGIECVWLLGRNNYGRLRDVPAYLLFPKLEAQTVHVPLGLSGMEALPLSEGVRVLFGGSLAEWIDPLVTHACVATQQKKCYRKECAKLLTLWYIESVDVKTRCGLSARCVTWDYAPHLSDRVERAVQGPVRRAILASDLPKPTLFKRRVTQHVPEGYTGQICPHCNSIQGDYFIEEGRFNERFDVPVNSIDFPLGEELLRRTHCCEDAGFGRCEQRRFSGPTFPNGQYQYESFESAAMLR
jgi:competence protein CoiA